MNLKKGDKIICISGDDILNQKKGKVYTFKNYDPYTSGFIHTCENDYGFFEFEYKPLSEIPDDKLVAFRLTGNLDFLKNERT